MITEKGFVIKNTEEIRKEIIEAIRANNLIKDADFENESSLINQFTTIIADKMAEQYRVMSDVYNSRFIDLATGENLNNIAFSYGMERRVPRQQTINVEMKIKEPINITGEKVITKGYGFEISGNKFKSLEEVYFGVGYPHGIRTSSVKSYSFNSIGYTNIADLNGLRFHKGDSEVHIIIVNAGTVISLPSFLILDLVRKRIDLKAEYNTRDYLFEFNPSKNLDIFLNTNLISDEKKQIIMTASNSIQFENLPYIDDIKYVITTIDGRFLETDQNLRERIFELFFPKTINISSLKSKLEELEGVVSSYIDIQNTGTYIYVDGGYSKAIADLIEENLIWNQLLLHNVGGTNLTINSSRGIEIKFNRPNFITGLDLNIISVINTDTNAEHNLVNDVRQFIQNDLIYYIKNFRINQDFIMDKYLSRVYTYFKVDNLIINTALTKSGNTTPISFYNTANNSVIKTISVSSTMSS